MKRWKIGLLIVLFVGFLFSFAYLDSTLTGRVVDTNKIDSSYSIGDDFISVLVNLYNFPFLDEFIFNWDGTNYNIYDENLILMMNFEDNVFDVSRYGHNGIILSGVDYVNSKSSKGLNFTGGEGINISAHEDFNVDEFTISLWVKPDKTRTVLDFDSRDLHTCYIDGNNDAYCFGDNTAGKLGDGTTTQSYLPVKVSGDYKFREIAVSEDASCGILTNDSVVCWGEGGTGELGNGGTADSSTPVFVNTNLNFTTLTSANHLMCGYLENGSAVCWGYGSAGQFGDGVSSNRLTPAFIAPSWNFTQYAFGEVHTCGILYNGTVYCWGNNGEGERGDNSTLVGDGGVVVNTPVPVVGDNLTFKWIDAGEDQNCGILTNGSLMCWGENAEHQLGVEGIDRSLYPIFADTSLDGFDRVYLSKHVGFGFLENGSVVAWGCSITQSSYGEGTINCSTKPILVNWDFDYEIDTLTNPVWNSEHYCFLNDGLPYCWGESKGNNGLPFDSRYISFPVKFLLNNTIFNSRDEIFFGGRNYCLLIDGNPYCVGNNVFNNLGTGEKKDVISYPTSILRNFVFDKFFKSVDVSCGILENGSAMCWGRNDFGQLGDNTTLSRDSPVFIYGNYSFDSLYLAHLAHPVCGLLQNGTAMCWGRNDFGQLGDNSTIQKEIPTTVYGNYNFSSLDVGRFSVCGILENGTAMCWGRNDFGQLGDNSTIQKEIPTPVYGDYTFNSISRGLYHTCGLLQNGAAMCWGLNNDGQLGDNTTVERYIPTSVYGNYSFSEISLAPYFTCGLLQNGAAMCWGRNNYGQLGNGNFDNSKIPVFVLGNLTFSEIYPKFFSVWAIEKNSQDIYSFGENVYVSAQTGEDFYPVSEPISIYTEDIFSKEEKQFKVGLTYDGNLRAISALRYFDYELEDDWNNVVLKVGDDVGLYVNGDLVDTHEGVIIPKDILDDLEIGKNSNAQIDELRMYNRSLSNSEIQMLYKSNLKKVGNNWEFEFETPKENKNYDFFAKAIFGSSVYELALTTIEAYSGSTGIKSTSSSITSGGNKFLDEPYSAFYQGNQTLNFDIAVGEENVSESVTKVVKESHSMTVEEIKDDSVVLLFESDPIRIELKVNESEKIDLQNDGTYDIFVQLISIVNGKPNIVLTPIKETVEEKIEEVVEDWKEGKTPEEIEQIEKKSNLVYWIVLGIVGLVLIFILIRFLVMKKKN